MIEQAILYVFVCRNMSREQAAEQFVADIIVQPERRHNADSVSGYPDGLVLVTAEPEPSANPHIWRVQSLFYESIRNIPAYCRALGHPQMSLGQLMTELSLELQDIRFRPIAARYLDREIQILKSAASASAHMSF